MGLLRVGSLSGVSSSDPSAMCPFFLGEPPSELSIEVVVPSPDHCDGDAKDVSQETWVALLSMSASSSPRPPRQ